ncbi:PH domain-containing protein [Streptomyces albidoflavus]
MSTEHGTPELPPLPVDFRPAKTRAVLLAAAVAIFVVVSAVALLLDSLSPAEKTSFVFTAALLAGILVLLARPRVRADEDGVTVVNITRVRRLAWAEIVRVNLRTGDAWVFLDLSDGTSMPVLGIQPGNGRVAAVRDARLLRALAERHSSELPSGG